AHGVPPPAAVGRASTATSLTLPRMPHQATKAPARGDNAMASVGPGVPSARGRQRQRLSAAPPETQAMRARIVAAQTANATHAYWVAVARSSRPTIGLS